ncbi:MAG: hypothetical protein ACUVUC_13845 [Thermoguttaceae bacterium]
MSDELKRLQRQLEQATGRGEPEPGLDPQTASLREAWRAFGQLLEAAHPVPEQPLVMRPRPAAGRGLGWLVAAAVAVAASLLIGVTIAWRWARQGPPADRARPSEMVAQQPQAPESPIAEEPPSMPEPELAWDDPLDNQIVFTRQALLSLQEDWPVLADASDSVQYGIQQMEKEVLGGSL